MKCKKLAAFLAAAMLLTVPCNMVSAASVSFSNFNYKTTPSAERWARIVSKTKADNEQNWYATITNSSGLSSDTKKPCRAMFVSGRSSSNSIQPDSSPRNLYSSTRFTKNKYSLYIKKGTRCWLYIAGNENNKKSYKVRVSGRYTS